MSVYAFDTTGILLFSSLAIIYVLSSSWLQVTSKLAATLIIVVMNTFVPQEGVMTFFLFVADAPVALFDALLIPIFDLCGLVTLILMYFGAPERSYRLEIPVLQLLAALNVGWLYLLTNQAA